MGSGDRLLSSLPLGSLSDSVDSVWFVGYWVDGSGEHSCRVSLSRLVALRLGDEEALAVYDSGVVDGGVSPGSWPTDPVTLLPLCPMNWLPWLPADVRDLASVWVVGYVVEGGVRRSVRIRGDSVFSYLGL